MRVALDTNILAYVCSASVLERFGSWTAPRCRCV